MSKEEPKILLEIVDVPCSLTLKQYRLAVEYSSCPCGAYLAQYDADYLIWVIVKYRPACESDCGAPKSVYDPDHLNNGGKDGDCAILCCRKKPKLEQIESTSGTTIPSGSTYVCCDDDPPVSFAKSDLIYKASKDREMVKAIIATEEGGEELCVSIWMISFDVEKYEP